MPTSMLLKIADSKPDPRGLPPPGNPKIWEALRKAVGTLECEASKVIFIQASGKSSLPTESFCRFWLTFPGLQKITSLQKLVTVTLQVRSHFTESDPIITLLREQLEAGGFGTGHRIWIARQFEFNDSPQLLTALNTCLSHGPRSGFFHPAHEEGRVAGPEDSLDWPDTGNTAVTSIKEAYRDAYLKGYWAALRRRYRVEEQRPRTDTERRDVVDPLGTEFQVKPNAPQGVEDPGAPLCFVAGLPNAEDLFSNADRLAGCVEKLAALYDRSVGSVTLRESATPLLTLDVLSPLPVNQRPMSTHGNSASRLYLIGPWDYSNALVERRVQSWVSHECKDPALRGEIVDGEQDLVLFFLRLAAREDGWQISSDAALKLLKCNARRIPSLRAWFFWSDQAQSRLTESAENCGVPLTCLGRPNGSAECQFVDPQGKVLESVPFSMLKTESQDVVDAIWQYPEVKSPTYGFDKAAVYPDQYMRHVTARTAREKVWAPKAHLLATGDRQRGVTNRRYEAAWLPYFRWTDGRSLWAESVGSKEGWMDVDPMSAGAAAADAAIRGALALGAKTSGGTASLWATQPWIDKVGASQESSVQWGAYLLALEGASNYLKAFGYELSAIEAASTSFPGLKQELLVRLRSSVSQKLAPVASGFRMAGEVLYAIGPRPAFVDAGSRILSHVRVMSNHTMNLSVEAQKDLYEMLYNLIVRGMVTCIRPVGEGGIVGALGEMSLWGGLGAQIRPNLPTIELFSASPGRFVVGILPSEAKALEARVKSELLTPLGLTGGEKILGLPVVDYLAERQTKSESE